MEIKYIPDTEFVIFIKQLGDKAQLKAIDGHFRWVVTGEDGIDYIARPEECRSK